MRDKLKELSVLELLELFQLCDESDDETIALEIQQRTGINILEESETDNSASIFWGGFVVGLVVSTILYLVWG